MADGHGQGSGSDSESQAVHPGSGGSSSPFAGFNFFGFGKKKAPEHVDPKAPIPVYAPNAPPYHTRDGLYPTTIKFKGMYDLDGLYRFMANWLRQHRYELNENLYKFKPPEFEVRWTAERKATGFVMEVITIYWHSWGEYDLDVVISGKKKRVTNARMKLVISGAIEAPYEDIFGTPRWTHNAVERRLLNLFRNWFFRREIESVYWDTLYYEMYRFQGAIKDFLKVEAKGNVY